MIWKALIIDNLHKSFETKLKGVGVHTSYRVNINRDEIREALADYHILVLRSKIQVDREILCDQPNLKVIARVGSGMDNIDVESAEELGIICLNAPEGNRVAVGEQTLGMLLSLASNISSSNKEVAKGLWNRERNRGYEISKKTVGLIGYGNTGTAVAQRLKGFECRIIAYDKYKNGFGNDHVEEVTYEDLIKQSDIISFHIPFTSETKAWISDDFIEAVDKDFVLLNLSRGGIMDTDAIIRGLDAKKITAFASDVLENEDLKSHTAIESARLKNLIERRNVIVTPHIGGWTVESYRKLSEILADKVINALKIKLVSTREI